jgi:hypothetical protein
MFCLQCGAQTPDGDRFCAACGRPVKPAGAAPAFGPPPPPVFRAPRPRHPSILLLRPLFSRPRGTRRLLFSRRHNTLPRRRNTLPRRPRSPHLRPCRWVTDRRPRPTP